MELRTLNKKGQVSQLPNFFQIMMLVVIFAGLTFIVLEKFLTTSYIPTTSSHVNETIVKVNSTRAREFAVYDYREVGCGAVTDVRNSTWGVVINSGNYTQASGNCSILFTNKLAAASLFNNSAWNITYTYTFDRDSTATSAIDDTTNDLYDYGIGFIGIIILVTMIYLILSIIRGRSGAK